MIETQDESPNPFCKWPRNLSCFCGTGLKFKKCCGLKLHDRVLAKDYRILKEDFDRVVKFVKKLKSQGVSYKLKKPIL